MDIAKLWGKTKRYFWNILISIDQLFNTLLGGDPDETLSSRMGKRGKDKCPVCFWICMVLHVLDRDHCEKSIEHDRGDRGVIK